ncbi:MAG: DUF4397 domain-containing protein [Terriglobales bacterium]|jgi:hypothetical protein
MFRLLKALLLASAIAALGILTASCNSNNQTQVRFVHAIPDAGALDIDVNGTKYFTNVAFTELQPASGYTVVPEGRDTIQGLLAGSSTVAFNRPNVILPGGRQYTVVATGFDTGFEGENVVILNPPDDNREPPNGIINFRVINASPDSPGALDIYIQKSGVQTLTPPATIGSLAYEQTSKYIPEPYNTSGSGYTAYVCPAGSTTPIFQQTFVVGGPNEGSIRTLILTDQQGVEELNPRFVELDDLN